MFRIVAKRKTWYIISSLLVVLSIASIIILGLRVGVDYNGGSILELKTSKDISEITKKAYEAQEISSFQIKSGGSNTYTIRSKELSNDQKNTLVSEISKEAPDLMELSFDNIGPTVGKDLLNKSIYSVIIAALAIITFIAYAFRKIPKPLSSWKFGTLAVVALMHDLLITLGFISFVGYFYPWMEIDYLFITAMLTIMGFSVHDTIVIYDRLRENFIRNRHKHILDVAEESVNQTLARSINTSITTVIVLLALFILGGTPIRHFVLILMFGITIGTYSSIFVATPLLVSWHKNINKTS
ncbi:MAG: preprotein translocase subunit SecF [bacterium ADurb.Bin212]|nr:MAG: preprotein translocase subunit SecF [bacterium ADurb.Bin212]